MQIRIPQLAEGINSGTVVSVLVSQGDVVKKDQTLLELETEKAVAPIPSSGEGKVESIHVKEGDKVSVGQVIVTLAGANGSGAKTASKDAKKEEKPKAESHPAQQAPPQMQQQQMPAGMVPMGGVMPMTYQYQSESGSPPPASPTVRKLAQELGIDLMRVKGTERGGRITVQDVRTYILHLQQLAFRGMVSPQSSVNVPEHIDFSKWGAVSRKPMTNLRKKISEKMLESWTTIPHVTQFDEADITDLLALRKKFVDAYEKKGARLTVTAFIFKAVVKVLKQHGIFNASIDDLTEEIVYKDYYHLGLAVDTEQGLIVPVIRNVDKKSMVEICEDIHQMAEKTRQRKVAIEDLQGGTFTISNQGGIGSSHFTPIINKPEVAILGVGQGALKPVVKSGDRVQVRMMLPLTLSYDHRLIDGGKAAKFMEEIVKAIQEFPESEVRIAADSAVKNHAKASKKGKK